MAIESAVFFRRLVRTRLSVLIALFCLCGFVQAQTPVTSGSPIPLDHASWNQIIKVVVGKSGSTMLLDWANSALYQLRPGSTTFTTIANGAPLDAAGTFWDSGMTIDAQDTIYIASRYGPNHFFRIPYNPVDGTYDFTASNGWGANIGAGNPAISLQIYNLAFVDSAAKDGSGTLVVATETSNEIYTVPVDNKGNPGAPTIVVKGLKARATSIAADVNGNIYFAEDEGNAASTRITGLFFIPAGKTGISGAGDGSAEAQISRIDPTTNTDQFSGISLDAAGNIYVASQSDSNGGAFNGDLMIPNVSGSPLGVSLSSFDFNKATFITPVQSTSTLTIDPRGFLWIPTGGGGWSPPGSLPYPGTKNVVLWQLGAANVGSSPVGTAGTPGTVFFNFSQSTTPGKLVFSQPGTGSDFVASSTNPLADPRATTPVKPCTPGTQYAAYTSCPYFVSLNARTAGAVSGQLSMLDASGAVIPQSTAILSGIGQGPNISLLVPTSQTAIGSGLVAPQQVAADSLGNSYVADSGKGQVLKFASGASSTTAGVPVGSGLTAPTGVAVDGSGDVYIADSGKVVEVPFVNGALNAAGQVTLVTGLGTNLKLAADGSGNVFVADPDKARVVKLSNPLTSAVVDGIVTLGSGFTKPSAVATDNSGNIFVADGSTLSEIVATFDGPPSAITNSLAAPVTGLAVDPSGSVDVAQTGGILHIPAVAGSLNANNAVAVDGGVLTKPNGLAIDSAGNLYVSDLTGTTPNLEVLNLSASVDFGQVSPFVPSNPVDVDVYNIGNLPLTIMPDPTFSGPMGAEFSTTPAAQSPCDTTGGTPVAPGAFCIIDVQLTAADVGRRDGTMNVTSNAINAPTVTAALTGFGVNNLERSKVSMVVNPSTGVSYPGATQVTVTVAPTTSTTTPTGQVILQLINQNPKFGGSKTYPAGTLANGVVTFNLSGILGGTYTVKATYHGDTQFSGGVVTMTLVVAQATPAVTLSEPSNITPIQGTYYVLIGSNTTLTATVTSPKGTPTNTVSFMNGSQLADPKQGATTLDANGSATFNTGSLPAGLYNLTAVYSGDQNFASVTSPVITFQVLPPSVLLTATPPTLTITAGTPVQTVLSLQSLVTYEATQQHGGVQIACDNTTLPRYAECTFDVPQPYVTATQPGTTTLTISTNLPVNIASAEKTSSPLAFASLVGLGVLGLAFRRRVIVYRSVLNTLCLMLLLAGVAMGVSGCTNSGYTNTPPAPHVVTPSGSYSVRVYGVDPVSGGVVTLPFTIPVTVK